MLPLLILLWLNLSNLLICCNEPYRRLNKDFCRNSRNIRSIYMSQNGFTYTYMDNERGIRKVTVESQFIEDELYQYEMEMKDQFITGSFIIPRYNLYFYVGIFPALIEGHFVNHNDIFQIRYSVNFFNYLGNYIRHEDGSTIFEYEYNNICYQRGCISDKKNAHRAYLFGLCHDSGADTFYTFNKPCYKFNGNDTEFEYYFQNMTVNPQCKIVVEPSTTPNFCGQEELATPILNTLFPYNYSHHSKGGMFRTLLYHEREDILIWIENNPFRYRYLQNLLDPYLNYSDSWVSPTNIDPAVIELSNHNLFSGAFTFPNWRLRASEPDNVYFLIVPKNFTHDTPVTFRRAISLIPLRLDSKIYTLDQIVECDCKIILSNIVEQTVSYAVAYLLVASLIVFLILITLMTSKSSQRAAKTTLFSNTQSAIVSKLQRQYYKT